MTVIPCFIVKLYTIGNNLDTAVGLRVAHQDFKWREWSKNPWTKILTPPSPPKKQRKKKNIPCQISKPLTFPNSIKQFNTKNMNIGNCIFVLSYHIIWSYLFRMWYLFEHSRHPRKSYFSTRIVRLLWKLKKKTLLKSRHTKKCLPNKQIPESENSDSNPEYPASPPGTRSGMASSKCVPTGDNPLDISQGLYLWN